MVVVECVIQEEAEDEEDEEPKKETEVLENEEVLDEDEEEDLEECKINTIHLIINNCIILFYNNQQSLFGTSGNVQHIRQLGLSLFF